MAVTITSSPATTPRPAGQYLIYTLDETATPDRFIVQVYRSTSTTTVGAEQAKIYLVPNASGVSHFDLSRIAEGILEYPLSKGGVAIHAVQDAAKVFFCDELALLKFTVRAGQYNGTTESLNQDNDEVYLLRGVEQISSGLNPSFSDYYPTGTSQKAWLTDRQYDTSNSRINMRMAIDDEAVALIMLTDNMGQSTSVDTIQITGFDASGSVISTVSATVSASTNTKENLLCVPIGPAHWSFLGLTGSLAYVDFNAYKSTATAQLKSQKIRVTLDERPCKHDATQLAWINSRGGWDYLRFDGRAPYTVNTTSKEYRKNVGTYGQATFTIASDIQQYDVYGKVAKDAYTLTEQFFTAEERDLLQYLMRSNVVQMRVGTGEWEPCIVRNNSLRIEPQGSKFYAVSLDVEIARDIRC